MKLKILIRDRQSDWPRAQNEPLRGADLGLYSELSIPKRPCGAAFAASLTLHAGLCFAMGLGWPVNFTPRSTAPQLSAKLTYTIVRVPPHLYLARKGDRSGENYPRTNRRSPLDGSRHGDTLATAVDSGEGARTSQFLALPNAPELPLPAAVRVPTITLVELKAAPPRAFVPPVPKPATTQAAPLLEAPTQPSAAPPVPRSVFGQPAWPKPPALQTGPATLPTPPALASPSSVPSIGSLGRGDDLTPSLVSVSDLRIPVQETLVVPYAMHLGGAGSGAGRKSTANSSDANGSNSSDGGHTTAGNATAVRAAGADSVPANRSNADAEPPPGVVRITRPKDGKFDVVVVQGSESGGFDESAGILQGKPVYTAYLSVGSPKDWVLQYCLPPSAEEASVQRNVVRLDSGAPLSGPYPTLILKPTIDIPAGQRLYIHGRITAGGRANQLRIIGKFNSPESATLLRSVAGWEFRPATKDGSATAVDFLLAVPSDSVN